MADVTRITVALTGFQKKKGEPPKTWQLWTFTDSEGKRYQTFDEEIASTVKPLVDEDGDVSAVLDITAESRPNPNGGTFVDNTIHGAYKLGDEPEKLAEPKQRGGRGGGGRTFDPKVVTTATAVQAFEQALKLVETGVISLDEPKLSDITKVAEAILGWAKGAAGGGAGESASSKKKDAEAEEDGDSVPN